MDYQARTEQGLTRRFSAESGFMEAKEILVCEFPKSEQPAGKCLLKMGTVPRMATSRILVALDGLDGPMGRSGSVLR